MATDKRRGGAATSPALLLLLAIAVGIAGWNYQRNLEAERREFRPYRGYAEADLDALIEAYSTQLEASETRWNAVSGQRARIAEKARFDEQVEEFERVQKVSRGSRDVRNRFSDAQATLEELRRGRERQLRERDAWRVHLRRLATVR